MSLFSCSGLAMDKVLQCFLPKRLSPTSLCRSRCCYCMVSSTLLCRVDRHGGEECLMTSAWRTVTVSPYQSSTPRFVAMVTISTDWDLVNIHCWGGQFEENCCSQLLLVTAQKRRRSVNYRNSHQAKNLNCSCQLPIRFQPQVTDITTHNTVVSTHWHRVYTFKPHVTYLQIRLHLRAIAVGVNPALRLWDVCIYTMAHSFVFFLLPKKIVYLTGLECIKVGARKV